MQQPGAKPAPSSFKNEVVVVVEDSQANTAAISGLLKRLAFDVVDFPDGAQAWDWLKALPATEAAKIKVVFCDVAMPKMNGLELLKLVRASRHLKLVRFVFCSAVIDPPVVREARSLASDGYIVKPIMPSVLQKKLDELFPGRKANRPA